MIESVRACSLLAVAGALVGACKAPPLPESTTEIDTRSTNADWSIFTIGPGDLVHVSVFGQPDYSSPPTGVRVGPDGKLVVPLLGGVDVSGMTASEASEELESRLGEYLREPSVAVSILEYASRRFYVLGDVRSPGPVSMDRPVTALEALSMSGGPLPGARLPRVVVIRKQGDDDIEVIPFNAETPGPDGLVQIRPDDMVFVPRSGVGVFREEVLPYLQGLGYTFSQIAAVTVAYERIDD